MLHPIYGVLSVDAVADYTLRIQFNDNTEQIINFQPVLAGELYGPLKDVSLFNQVTIDPEIHTLIWPNGADFEAAILYDWPKYIETLAAHVKQWDHMSM